MRFTITGTHKGDFMGIPPTGKKINVSDMSIFHIANRQIIEHWGTEDSLGWLQRIGSIPLPDPTRV